MPLPRRPLPGPRALVPFVGAVLTLAVAAASGSGSLSSDAPASPLPLADRLSAETWAFAIPVAWLAAPIPGLRSGDVLDLVGARPS